ncbi:hypothetical protein CHUAL_004805 [Chamberlinius hualienensis]
MASSVVSRNVAALRKVYVVGVGMTKFEKPGRRENFDYPDMAKEAVTNALSDSSLKYGNIEQACVGYVYGDSTCGQRALYQMGLTGIPIYNVNNNCSTGSSALLLAKQLVEGGVSECTLALGFEKMERGSLGVKFSDRTNPLDRHVEVLCNIAELEGAPMAAQMFGAAGVEHMKKYGTTQEQFAKIAFKNHLHSTRNPKSQFQDKYTLDQILASPQVYGPLTKLQCCPTSDGAAAAILASGDFVVRNNLQAKAIEILGIEMATDLKSTFDDNSAIKMVGYDMTKAAADKLYNKTGVKPADVDVIELHDCFSVNELLTYEALGLCPTGKGGEMVESGNNTYGGKYVVNPSGGLISKGHPLGATGLAQCSELCWQLRGEADKRQVPNAKIALQHNIGLGGASVVALYKHGFPQFINRVGARHVHSLAARPVLADNVKAEDFDAHLYFKELEQIMEQEGAQYVKQINSVIRVKVKSKDGKEGLWTVDARAGSGKLYFGPDAPPASVTFSINDEDIGEFITGNLDPQKAYFQGRLKIAGSLATALRLKDIALKHKNEIASKL